MLSNKIICAIDIVNILSEAYRLSNKGLKKSEIISKGCMPVNFYNPVLSELSRNRIITRTTTSLYCFSQEMAAVSLYDLVIALHSGLSIGEFRNFVELRGTFNYKSCYQPFVSIENALKEELINQLKNIKLSNLINTV